MVNFSTKVDSILPDLSIYSYVPCISLTVHFRQEVLVKRKYLYVFELAAGVYK